MVLCRLSYEGVQALAQPARYGFGLSGQGGVRTLIGVGHRFYRPARLTTSGACPSYVIDCLLLKPTVGIEPTTTRLQNACSAD